MLPNTVLCVLALDRVTAALHWYVLLLHCTGTPVICAACRQHHVHNTLTIALTEL